MTRKERHVVVQLYKALSRWPSYRVSAYSGRMQLRLTYTVAMARNTGDALLAARTLLEEKAP